MNFRIIIIIFLQIHFTFQKSIKHILPQNDDCRSLQICLQAASMNLQLSQTPNSNGEKEDCRKLIHPLLPRDSEVLQSLTRLCFNVPHSKEFFKEVLQSAGLHILAVLFNPTLLVFNPGMTLLDLDLVNVLIILTGNDRSCNFHNRPKQNNRLW